MPQRTNQFQRIVHVIADLLAPSSATVRSSVELPERESGILREVDTVIEIGAGLSMVRIAVECRERGRRADVQWIDELIGKYSRLPIDRIVAVSSSGFSRGAHAKAVSHNIDLITPKEVTSIDWPERFAKPRTRFQIGWTKLRPLALAGVDARGLRCRIRDEDTVLVGPATDRDTYKGDQFIRNLFKDAEEVVLKMMKKDATAVVREIRDGKAAVLCTGLVENSVLVRRGKAFPMKEFVVLVEVQVSDLHDTVYATYGDALVGRVSFAGYDIATVQRAGASKATAVFEVPKHLRTDGNGPSEK